MATLSLNQMDKSGILDDSKELKKKYRAKNTEYYKINVPHNEVPDYEAKGFSVVSRTARKTSMTKIKDHSVKFEDDIWCMFYKLGFRILNEDENLHIQWGPNKEDTQQIDVLAVGSDAIFVVECKAAEKATSHSFANDINNMGLYMPGLTKVLQKAYGEEKRVKFIFATRKYRIVEDGADAIRMKNFDIFHLNDNSYNYINNLIKSYKESVIYQFYALMFKNELINEQTIKIPVLRGSMGGNYYYIFSIEPNILLKIGFVLHRTKVNDSMAPTYQRLLVPSRLKGITKFIDNGGYFPNSIIINFSAERDDLKVKFSRIKADTDSHSEFGFLYIPNAYGIAYIIDGQHRLYGYAQSQYKETHTIPVVAFENMSSEDQLKIFMDINENQKSVSPSLRLDLEEDMYWKSGRLASRMKALRSSIIKSLSADASKVLYNKISIGEDNAKLTFPPFDTALNHSGLIPKAKQNRWESNLDTCIFDIHQTELENAMTDSRKKITQFIDGAYDIADRNMSDGTKDSFLFSNRATYAFIVLIGSLHAYLIRTNRINTESTIKERLNVLEPYIKALSEGLNNISKEESTNIKSALGQGADVFWLRSYQNIINQFDPEYSPEELSKWKETQDKGLQEEGAARKRDIKKQLKLAIFDRLEKVYGDRWINNVAKLRHDVEGRIIDEFQDLEDFDLAEYDWKDYLEISDFKDIIEKNFSFREFEEAFAIPIGGRPFKSKKDKLYWMNLIIEPKGKKKSALTSSDLNNLELINTFLAKIVEE